MLPVPLKPTSRAGKAKIVMSVMSEDQEWLRRKLTELYDEHRRLDEGILLLGRESTVDFLNLQRLKKRKLALKDQIHKIESELLPDIIA